MEYNNNNWNSGNSSGSYSAQDGYMDGRQARKEKKGVTLVQLIASLLVVAVLSSGLTAYFVSTSANNKAAAESNGAVVVDESKAPSTPASHPSDNLNVATAVSTPTTEDERINVIQKSMSSVVGIYISATTISNTGDMEQQDTGSGSGVILTSDGYIVTNNHVVEGSENLRVYLQDGTESPATLVGTDSYSDLAVVKIEASGLPAATLGTSGSVTVGDPVYAIGNPLGVLTSSVSQGIISGLDRSITVGSHSMTLMQTDAAVNPGNSGGGLFNANGELIGIVNAKSYGLDVEGIGFAIPMDAAKPIISDLLDLGYVTGRPYLGINMQDVALRSASNSFGPFSYYMGNYETRVQITDVQAGSPAEKAGFKVNDILISLDDTEVTGTSQLSGLLYAYKVGDTVTISVYRGNETIKLPVTLGERQS